MSARTGFRNRSEAGRRLALDLSAYADRPRILVLGLPRGGIPVAFEVARALAAPLDVFVVRKLGVPGQPELAMGAIASGGVRILNEDVVAQLGITEDMIARVAAEAQAELERREHAYRAHVAELPVRGRTVILVDDGLATGSTMSAAVAAVRAGEPAEIVVAVPVAPSDTCRSLRALADAVVCCMTPDPFQAVGVWYEEFDQTTDDEVRALLDQARREFPAPE